MILPVVVICSKFITFAVTNTTRSRINNSLHSCDLLKIHYLCGDKYNKFRYSKVVTIVVICSKFITFAVTNTTRNIQRRERQKLWFAQNSLPLRWQIQPVIKSSFIVHSCDLLKIHYLCGDKDNAPPAITGRGWLWFAQNSLPLRWQIQHGTAVGAVSAGCDLLKIHYLCGDKYNQQRKQHNGHKLWFAQNSLPLRWQIQPILWMRGNGKCCDLLKIHYLCGDKYNVIDRFLVPNRLWFAQNSLPLRWQIQLVLRGLRKKTGCDLLKIHYLCGDKYNRTVNELVTPMLWFAQNSLPLRWQIQH